MNKLTSSHKVFLHEYNSPAWNLCSYCLLRKQVSFDALEAAMNEVVRKNDALRMIIKKDDMVEFEAFHPRHFDRVSFSDESSFLAWAKERANEPVTNHPGMWTAFLIEINGSFGVFNVGQHIMCDALNVANLYQKIANELEGNSDEGESYSAYLEANEKYLQSRQYEKDRQYWEPILSARAPLAFGGKPMGKCENITITLPAINAFCAEIGLSKAAVMYAVTGLLLMRLQSLDALSVGIPVLGRTTQREMGALGLFMRDVPMTMHGGEKSFLDFAGEVENHLIDLFRHRRYDLPQNLLFDVSVDYSEYPRTKDYDAAVIYSDFLSTAMEFHFLQREQLELTIRAQTGLFKNVGAVAEAITRLLQAVMENPQQSIWALPLAELPQFGATVEAADVGLYALVEKQNGGRIIEGTREYSLAELRRDAEKIDAAVRGEKRAIGVLCERSYGELAAIYGIVRGGNAYLPISPDYPAARIQLLLEQSGCKTVLAQRKYRHIIPDALVIEDILEGDLPNTVPAISALPEDPLYVLFTSGSTGTPKGAMVSNRSAVNRIRWMCEKYFSPETVVMLKTPFTFDVSVWEIFGFALGGFTLYILPPEDHYRQDRVVDHIRRGKVTDLHFVPTVFSYFLDALEKDGKPLPSLKKIFLSGEALSASLVNRAPAPVHNLYGPTECAVDVTYYDCAAQESDPIPIGKPIDNCQMYVLDQRLQPLPIGIVGQIYIGGTPVGMGYVNDAKRTADVFVPNPYADGRLYRTGDLGYWREDGQLIYVGRADNQVKIHGQRIELGEIETALNTLVPTSVVAIEEDRLIAFYTGAENNSLREQLGRILPRHMIPSRFVRVDAMPLTASGKADRRALLRMPRQEIVTSVAPATREEELMLNAVKEALHLPEISITDNFFELGGDSLSSLVVVTLLQDMGYDLSVTDFLKSETLEVAAGKMNRLTAAEETFEAGTAPVPPIVKAYQYEKPLDPSSFAQSCVIPMHAPEQEVRRALDAVVDHHEMLRAVFNEDGSFSIGNGGYAFRSACNPPIDETVSFDLRHGPLVDAVLYPENLKLTIHHFVVDAVSWSVIISDLNAALHNEPLSARTGSYLEWARTTNSAECHPWPADMLPLLQLADPHNPEERYRFSAGAAPNDVVLTALGCAANALVEGRAGICVETHGRTSARYRRTVGWFTAIFPFVTSSLEETKDALSRVPNLGAGYLPSHGHLPKDASILYNYLSLSEGAELGVMPLFPGKISVNCLKQGAELLVEIGVPAGHHPQGIAQKLGHAMKQQLEMLLADASELDHVLQQYSAEDVYDLTPTQLGMYRNWERYYLNYTIELGEKPDAQRLEKAVTLLARRHPILRSKFVELGDGTVKQLIVKDWQMISDSDKLFRVKPSGTNLTVETHHIILDGWSLSILARDLIAYYHAPETRVFPTAAFGQYSQWLHTQPAGLAYWKDLLSGCGVSSDLPHVSNAVGRTHEVVEHLVSADGVVSFAKEHRVSVNTVLETAFAMLLKGNSAVIFGKMVSGRNAPIPGIDEIVGPFVNMVPVHVKSSGDILSQIHEQSIMANEFGFTPLAELYAHTDLRRINILFVFENYPSASEVSLIDYREGNEFDLTVSVRETEDGYLLRASYAPEKYERFVMEEMTKNFDASLRKLLSDEGVLDAPQTQSLPNYEAPMGEMESAICKLFEKVIGIETVGRHDNFYDLGGTSLNMMELLCEAPLEALSPSEFMQNPTPAGLTRFLTDRSAGSPLVLLYTPENATAAYVLFPYGGGDAAAYTALVTEFRKRNASVELLFVPWGCDYDLVAGALRSYPIPLCFYSHCAGAAIAMKLLDRVNCVQKYIAGASIPPEEMQNIWPSVPNEMLLSVLYDAGMPKLPNSQEDTMLRQFRENTDEYFCYFSEKKRKTPAGVTLVLSREDIFTRSYPQAAELWNRYIARVDTIHYMDSATHYFQSTKAFELAEILLKEAEVCCKK